MQSSVENIQPEPVVLIYSFSLLLFSGHVTVVSF